LIVYEKCLLLLFTYNNHIKRIPVSIGILSPQ